MSLKVTWRESKVGAFDLFSTVPEKVLRLVDDKKANEVLLEQISEDFLERLRDNFYSNRSDKLPALSSAYRRKKEKDPSLDNRLLMATKELVGYLKNYKRGKTRRFVGVGRRKHRGSGLLAGQLLGLLEMGAPSRNIPPRPIVALTWEEDRRRLVGDVERELEKMMREVGLI